MSIDHIPAAPSAHFVREKMEPSAPPPVSEAGIIGWFHHNLFSSIPNTILTLLAIYLVYLILPGLPELVAV